MREPSFLCCQKGRAAIHPANVKGALHAGRNAAGPGVEVADAERHDNPPPAGTRRFNPSRRIAAEESSSSIDATMTLSPAPGLTRDGVNGIASVTTPAMPCRCQPKTLPTEEYRNGYSIRWLLRRCQGAENIIKPPTPARCHQDCQRRSACSRATGRRRAQVSEWPW